MSTHELKTDPEPFEATVRDEKPYEVRYDDRDYQKDDTLILRETRHTGEEMSNGAPLVYTGRTEMRVVTEVRGNYGMQPGWVIMGVEKADFDSESAYLGFLSWI